MLYQEFHDLFAPSNGDKDSNKKVKLDKTASKLASKLKQRNKYYSISNHEARLAQAGFRVNMQQHQLQQQQLQQQQTTSQTTTSISKIVSPFIELPCNPSQFSVFAAIRQCVLEKQLKNAILIYNQTFGRINSIEIGDDDDESKNNGQVNVNVKMKYLINYITN